MEEVEEEEEEEEMDVEMDVDHDTNTNTNINGEEQSVTSGRGREMIDGGRATSSGRRRESWRIL